MASTTTKLLHLLALLSLLIAILHSQTAQSQDDSIEEDDDEYMLDSPFSTTHLRSRFLASIKKGKSCNAKKKNICNGVKADKGASLLYCCKSHCRNVLSDQNHCGGCLNKCPLGKDCCNSKCIDMRRDPNNCGKCGRQCKKGQKCGYGYCGYA